MVDSISLLGNVKKEKNYAQRDSLERYSIVTLSLISTLLIATSDMGQFDSFPRPDHLESNHRKHVLDPQFLSMSHLLPSFVYMHICGLYSL
ncbi:hypothetical protein K435DRAFT_209734 [Dendrothele bispora CBS 962.96]|uniref:Uncharacterized protein n=1 Tax=Dendrothele bispora (strain CBS 962.96) TaxID=1314807 RepID=A0A4S8LT41_DENBC|nr:hypothetical protein K435DRAFT_209734 [Dendrothele bispora CBS 962.96]